MMDDLPDSALINSPSINSVLKPPKPRVPLKDLVAAVPEEDNTAARKRRVSFANVNKIKEFSAGAESMVVCQTPAYEEPFYLSSDSSYPSGVDGWTPAKGCTSTHGKLPIYQEKENISTQSVIMPSGMDLTRSVGNLVCSSRYSENGMDLTGMANSHQSCINQQTRYSVNGMDITSMANPHQSFVDHRTRFSLGMDFTNVIGHSTHSTRYSINGMDLTEAANNSQHMNFDQRSARFSEGMDMTNVVFNPMNTMRYSCNEMDITEAANLCCNPNQSSGRGFSAYGSMNDSDALELTDVVNGVQFSAASPKVCLKENNLYSVNNTRYSVNSMDMTKAAGSRLPTARRKSSRYSLVNMDLTEAVNISCDDLEFTEAIEDPRIKAGSTRNSLCAIDMTEALVDEGMSRLSTDCMDHTSIVGDRLEYSADAEVSMNLTKNMNNSFDPPIYNNKNVLSNQNLNLGDAQAPLLQEDSDFVNLKLSNKSLCTSANDEPLSQIIHQNAIIRENENSQLPQNPIGLPLNNFENIIQKTCKPLVNENPNDAANSVELVSNVPKDNPSCAVVNESRVMNKDSVKVNEHKGFHTTQNINVQASLPSPEKGCLVVDGSGSENVKEKDTSRINEIGRVSVSSVEHVVNNSEIHKNENKTFVLNASNSKSPTLDTANKSLNLYGNDVSEELKSNKTGLSVGDFSNNCDTNEDSINQQKCKGYNENSSLKMLSENNELITGQSNEEAMDISIVDNNDLEKHKSNVSKGSYSPKTKTPESTSKCSKAASSLSESGINMSIRYCSLTEQDNDVESIDEQNGTGVVSTSVLNDNEINCQEGYRSNIVQEENQQRMDEIVATKESQIELNMSTNTSLNLSSRSVLCSKNITMTRGRSKSFIVTPETSLETSNKDCSVMKDEEINSELSTSFASKSHVNINEDRPNQTENNLINEISRPPFSVSLEKKGKRSFEEALEPDNVTEESPIKQLCLSREEPPTEYLTNVTAPSFLIETATANETLCHSSQLETAALVEDQLKSKLISPSECKIKNSCFNTTSKKMSETKVELSLRMGDSVLCNMSESPLTNEVIDLCESSLDATASEVREILNNSRYKTRHVCDDVVLTKANENVRCVTENEDPSGLNHMSSDREHFDRKSQLGLLEEPCGNLNPNKDETIETNVLGREVEEMGTDPLPSNVMAAQLEFGLIRKRGEIESLGNNCYAADFIPNLVEIQFSIGPFDSITSVNYRSICSGGATVNGGYFLKQARNCTLPEKGSDLILQLQSINKSFLARLARNINIICKYHNGSINENVLTLEVASCRNHFWAFIDVNIKHPQFLNQTDITISTHKIGELKLSYVRKVFSSIEKNQDQLLNFAKAMTKLQY